MADLASVIQGDLRTVPGQRLPQGAQLEADLHLATLRQTGLTERRQQRQVGIASGLRLPQLEGVLTEVVDRGHAAGKVKLARHAHRVCCRVARHETLHDIPAHRGLLDQITHTLTLGQLQQSLAQHTAWIQHVFLRTPISSESAQG